MDAPAKRSGSITFLLAGLILLLTAAGLFAAFAPVFRCRNCEVEIAIKKGITHLKFTSEPPTPHVCSHCDGKGRVTPLTHWLKCSEHFLP